MKHLKQLSTAITLGLFCLGYSQAQTIPTNGLVAYYPFNGNVNDASGNGNNGTNYGVTFAPNRFGVANAAAHFNAGEVLTGFFPPLGSAARTFSGWFQAAPSSSAMTLMAYGGSSTYAGDRFELVLWNSGQFALDCSFGPVMTAASYADSIWHSFVVVVPQNAALSNLVVYMDGVLQTNLASSAPGNLLNTASVNPLEFGDLYISGVSRPFIGSLSDVRIYSRTLSATEVQELYDATCLPHAATAAAEIINGFVVGATITDNGCGYTNAPLVLFQGGGGTGAKAMAVVSNGVVANIVITDAGMGYTSTPTILIGSSPSISVEPQPLTVSVHDNASFSVVPGDITPVNYQWSFNGNNLAGATDASLTISNVTPSDLGSYSVLLTNAFGGTNSSSVILSMYPYLTVPFVGALAYWGQETTLSVQADGSGPLAYRWYQNGLAVPNGTNSQLLLNGIQFTNSGLYWVVVSNPFGTVTNAPAEVVVNPAGVSLGLYPGVTISGTTGYTYLIQRTPELTNTNWVTLTNLTLAQPVQIWVDTSQDASKPANPRYFYRVLPGP